MKRLRIRTVLIFLFGVMAGSLLLRTSQDVQEEEDRLFGLEARIEKEQETIRVLKAEWEYLNSPLRLEALAKDYLPELLAPEPNQMMAEPAALPDVSPDMPVYGDYEERDLKPQPVEFSPRAKAISVKPKPKPQPIGLKKKPEKDFQGLLKSLGQEAQP